MGILQRAAGQSQQTFSKFIKPFKIPVGLCPKRLLHGLFFDGLPRRNDCTTVWLQRRDYRRIDSGRPGAFWFIPASSINAYWAFLLGLFILASGLACLETIANPYTTVLGPPESGATRINMAQTCNGLGWISGMFIGASIILSATNEVNTSNAKLYVPYLGIGIGVVILLVVFIFAKVPDVRAAEEFKAEAEGKATKSIFKRSHFTVGVVAQFLYVAAQTGIFSFFVNYVRANIADSTDRSAGYLQTWAFVCFAGGRFFGSAVVRFTKPNKSLAVYAVINTLMMVLAMVGGGWAGVIGIMASFFFMSIMFPTIFALSIRGLGDHTKLGSSVLVMSIVGGAIMTPLMGYIADAGRHENRFCNPADLLRLHCVLRRDLAKTGSARRDEIISAETQNNPRQKIAGCFFANGILTRNQNHVRVLNRIACADQSDRAGTRFLNWICGSNFVGIPASPFAKAARVAAELSF